MHYRGYEGPSVVCFGGKPHRRYKGTTFVEQRKTGETKELSR